MTRTRETAPSTLRAAQATAALALLVDEGRAVATAYGAIKPDGSGIQRTVVIVGKDGRVLYRASGAPPPGELLAAITAADD